MPVIKNKSISLTGNNTIFSRTFRKKSYRIDHQNGRLATCLRTKNSQYSGTRLQRRSRYNGKHVKARQNYSKICGNEPRYNEYILTVPTHNLPRCNEYFVRSLAAVRVKLNDKVFLN